MDGSLGKQFLKNYITEVRPYLTDFLIKEIEKSKEFGPIQMSMLEAFKEMVAEGKGIRGALVVLAYLVSGGTDKAEVTKLSTFIEIFHSAVLIEDDFMDRDSFRRGIPTVHVQFEAKAKEIGVRIPSSHYGNSIAVCLSSSAFYFSWKPILDSNFDSEKKVAVGRIYSEYIARLQLGQSLDMSITGRDEIKEDDVLKVLWNKSGEYTALLPILVGLELTGNKDPVVKTNLENYARCFGWAFQIQDDILGTFGEEQKLGKPVGSDFREGKNTLLILHLRKNGTKEQIDFMNRCLGNESLTVEDTTKLKQILIDSGSYEYVINTGWKYVEEGLKCIPDITQNKELQEILESLLVYMMERTK